MKPYATLLLVLFVLVVSMTGISEGANAMSSEGIYWWLMVCLPRRAVALNRGPDVAFQVSDPVGRHKNCTFEAPSRNPHARCLRFTARVTPTPRKTRYQSVD